MEIKGKATRIELFNLKSIQMRTFHMTWFAFFLCFFGWFGIAPLMAVIREDLLLTKAQIGNTIIASVAATVLVRMLIGPLCDRFGPRKTYTCLLILGALPVMGVGLATSYESFLLFRLAIGAIGASFVVTQFHTSVMFAPNVVGTANATAAGWGNLGGGVTQVVMPLLFSALLMLGVNEFLGWRLAMIVPGVIMLVTGLAYYLFTQDLPEGNFSELREQGRMPAVGKGGNFMAAARDYRVWALALVYGACFGTELTLHNVAALYFFDQFEVSLKAAGLLAGLYGMMNIFTRTLGGYCSDRLAARWGLVGRVRFLSFALLCAGLSLVLFSEMNQLWLAIPVMLALALCTQMSSGATYGLVPFLNRRALGSVAGIVGAGGNAGAVLAGFFFKAEGLSYQHGFLLLGCMLGAAAVFALAVRFSAETLADEDAAFRAALAARDAAPATA